ncbi:16S rRNA (cytosine(967)-C(5))-methyltransferase RsmB [Cardiobacteriaceae bacterium TAE3-ERU3]|nr:16S rRNA (cytosine(967)-C(5))-methyltransferase RsmB [Cardiobacteriaceae bacterium TAE3-ERU3]
MNARQAALETILAVIKRKQSLSQLMPAQRSNVLSADQGLYQALVYGTLREYESLSSIRDELLSAPLERQADVIGTIINLGLYQLLRMQLGDHGVINETVTLAKDNRCPQARGLINAILRRAQREREQCRELLDQRKAYNLPAWLKAAFPEDKAALAEVYTCQPPFTLRLSPKINREQWLGDYPTARSNPLAPQAVTIPAGSAIIDSEAFVSGTLSVQDGAAQLATLLLDPQNGERVLDACAAPGGKTGHILEYAPQAQVTALDQANERLEQVKENLERLGQTAILKATDAAHFDDWWDQVPFDAVLLDAPCSGSGVIRRHPDIAYLRSRKDLQQFPNEQMRLIEALWQTVKPGGRLLYVTCSILPAEGAELVQTFLTAHSDAQLRQLNHPACRDTGHGLLHLPDENGDGFFYALLDKAP